MRPDEIQKLLGGYATGTLTPAEQQALFEAALHDQDLFDALAKEQPLHDLLRDPAARAHLLAAIDERPKPWYRRRPMWAGGLALVAAACLAAAVALYVTNRKAAEKPILVADATKQPPQPTPARPPVEILKQEAAPPAPTERPEPSAASTATPTPVTEKKKSAAKDAEASKPATPEIALGRMDIAGRGDKKAEGALSGGAAGGVIGGVPPSIAENKQLQALDKVEPAKPAAAPPPASAPTPKFSADGAPAEATTAAAPKPAVVAASGFFDQSQQNAKELFYAGGPSQTMNQAQAQQAQLRQQLAARSRAGLGGVAETVPNPGVKWTALRKQPDGLFAEVEPEQIHAGDVIKLRLVPNDNGYVSMTEGTRRLLVDVPVQRLIPFETPEITSPNPGSKELTIVLARQPQARTGIVRVAADQQSVFVRDEKSNYTVNPNAPSLPVAVKIRLQYK